MLMILLLIVLFFPFTAVLDYILEAFDEKRW
jgi:hypothetical protein